MLPTKTDSVGRLIRRASNLFTRELDNFAKQYDLTSQQMTIIILLADNPDREVTQTDIQQSLNIRKSTTTELLQRMEKHELIERKISDIDSRKRILTLTKKSADLAAIVSQFTTEYDQKILSNLTENEKEIVIKFLQETTK